MTISDVFLLYLLPWAMMLGVLFVLGVVSWLTMRLFGIRARRYFDLFAVVLLAPFAYRFLLVFYNSDFVAAPFYLQVSLTSYGTVGVIIAIGALVTVGALLSEQIDRVKQSFKSADAIDL